MKALDDRPLGGRRRAGPRRADPSAPSRSWRSATAPRCATAAARSEGCGCARSGARRGRAAARRPRTRRRRARRAHRDRAGPVPRVGAPAADGDPRGVGQSGRGAAGVRRAAADAAGRARHGAGAAVMAVHARLLRSEPPAPGAARFDPTPGPLPAPLAATAARHAFVGREEALQGAPRGVGRGRPRPAPARLLAGEAGIGKSQVAAEFARTVHRDGAVVLYGRFDETNPGAYQPVLEMLRGWSGGAALTGRAASAHAPPTSRRCCRTRHPARLGDSLRRQDRAPAPVRRARRPARRDRGWRAAAARLRRSAVGSDSATLQLMRRLVRAPQPRRTMFLGTYREAEVAEDHPAARADRLAAARGDADPGAAGGPCGGRDGRAGRRIEGVVTMPPISPPPCSARRGNPLFVEEIVRHGGELEDAGVPEGVRELTSRRIARLPGRLARGDAGRVRDRARVRLRAAGGARPADRRRAGVGAR